MNNHISVSYDIINEYRMIILIIVTVLKDC